MVDGVLLLVDASEGPLPQTRFVLRKAPEAKLPVILVVNKVDRPDADRGGRERGLRAARPRRGREPDRVPDRLRRMRARAARAWSRRRSPDDLQPPGAPARDDSCRSTTPEHSLQALVTNLDACSYVGRLALARVHGTIRKGQQVAWCCADGRIERAKVTELYVTEALAGPGRGRRGRPGRDRRRRGPACRTIGETSRTLLGRPRPLPVTQVDKPSLSMTIGINTPPLSGREGDKLTASMPKGCSTRSSSGTGLAPRPPHRASGHGRCRAAASSSWPCSSS